MASASVASAVIVASSGELARRRPKGRFHRDNPTSRIRPTDKLCLNQRRPSFARRLRAGPARLGVSSYGTPQGTSISSDLRFPIGGDSINARDVDQASTASRSSLASARPPPLQRSSVRGGLRFGSAEPRSPLRHAHRRDVQVLTHLACRRGI